MYAKSPQFSNRPIQMPDDTQRAMRNNNQQVYDNNTNKIFVPGSKSLHIFNSIFFIFSLVQVILYAYQSNNSPCPQLSNILYGFMGFYIYTLLIPIILLICMYFRKGFTFAIIYTSLAALGKIGVVITVFVATQYHVGYCIVTNDVKVGIAIANVAEFCCILVELVWIRHQIKFSKALQVHMFMQAGRRRGYF